MMMIIMLINDLNIYIKLMQLKFYFKLNYIYYIKDYTLYYTRKGEDFFKRRLFLNLNCYNVIDNM